MSKARSKFMQINDEHQYDGLVQVSTCRKESEKSNLLHFKSNQSSPYFKRISPVDWEKSLPKKLPVFCCEKGLL